MYEIFTNIKNDEIIYYFVDGWKINNHVCAFIHNR